MALAKEGVHKGRVSKKVVWFVELDSGGWGNYGRSSRDRSSRGFWGRNWSRGLSKGLKLVVEKSNLILQRNKLRHKIILLISSVGHGVVKIDGEGFRWGCENKGVGRGCRRWYRVTVSVDKQLMLWVTKARGCQSAASKNELEDESDEREEDQRCV